MLRRVTTKCLRLVAFIGQPIKVTNIRAATWDDLSGLGTRNSRNRSILDLGHNYSL
jgi:hypothetical protein